MCTRKMIFKITFATGCFFRYLMDFITACVIPDNKCWLKFTTEGITLQVNRDNGNRRTDTVQCAIYLNLERSNFHQYELNTEVSLLIEPKQIQKLCKNVKKKDMLILSFDRDEKFGKLQLIIQTDQRTEVKSIRIENSFDNIEPQYYERPSVTLFKTVPFILLSSLMQNFKKGIGAKKEDVTVHINGNSTLKFITHSQDIASMSVTYYPPGFNPNDNVVDRTPCVIRLNGTIISLLTKLANLTKQLKWYERCDTVTTPILKITSILDTPNYMGNVEIFIYGPDV